MINASNMVAISGGLTRDPDYREDIQLVQFSIGVDNAGRKDGATGSGFFDVNVWLNDSKYSPAANAEYVLKAIKDGTLAKGSRVNLIGRLNHDQFQTKEGKSASRVTIVAENVLIVWSRAGQDAKEARSEGGGSTEAPRSASASASESDDDGDDGSSFPTTF